MKEINFVGKIDIKIFKEINDDIQTDEVIVTEIQVEHIKKSHPDDYENYFRYAKEIVEKPDCILEDNKPNSVVLLKKIEEIEKCFRLVLRLKISSDPEEYKNSIITFHRIEEKRLKSYTRTKKVLYSKE